MISVQVLCLIPSITTFIGISAAFQCDEDCADQPVFSPPSLTVKFGDPASFRCTACQYDCQQDQTGLTVSSGSFKKEGNTILWITDNMTDWDPNTTCYYTKNDGGHCCARLPLIVYKPPAFVFIFLQRRIDETQERDTYFLECVVHDVAPIENIIVTFYRRKSGFLQKLGEVTTNIKSKTPASDNFELKVETIEEDDEYQYWCEAKMDFGLHRSIFLPTHASEVTESRNMLVSAAGWRIMYNWNLCLLLLFFFHI